jgi:acetylornithine deacetylase/succinyl-diaminopimelate desuccinylase-like protein
MNTAATRTQAIAHATQHFDSGAFARTLAERVAVKSCSQQPDMAAELLAYLQAHMQPALQAMDFTCEIFPNPVSGGGPFLVARRLEDATLPTVLLYGHGDVIRGLEGQWKRGQGPWQMAVEGERWYGRGTADNKGQHSINLAAMQSVIQARGGRLGFNAIWLFETSEETGSPGLNAFCAAQRELLRADAFIASDGPRFSAAQPTVFLGSRGVANFTLSLHAREGGHHSGNWGGLLRNPGTVMAAAIASLVDGHGVIQVPDLRPPPVPDNVRAALAGLHPGGSPGDPEVDVNWGEPGLTPVERVLAWNALEVLAYRTGNPDNPVNAIPPRAEATLQLRFVVGTRIERLRAAVVEHLAARGFGDVVVGEPVVMNATRLSPDNAWVRLTLRSLEATTGFPPVLLPNLGGSLPNDVFSETLGLPTVWVPHSYPACQQHAPDEHVLAPLMRQGLQMMAGLFWDVGQEAGGLPRCAR